MPTKILVPRASGEGGMGVVDNAWGHAYFNSGNFKTGDFSDSIMISGLPLDQAITQGGLGGKWNDGTAAGDIYYNGGNVGIGTANPGYAMLHIDATSSTTDPFYIKRGGDSYMTCENGGDVIIGSLRFNNTNTPEVKSTSVGQNGSFTFYTSEGSQQPTGRMGINYTGVGIGTTNPSKQLHIQGTNASIPGIKISASDQGYEHEVRAHGDGVLISADSTNYGGAGPDIRFNVSS